MNQPWDISSFMSNEWHLKLNTPKMKLTNTSPSSPKSPQTYSTCRCPYIRWGQPQLTSSQARKNVSFVMFLFHILHSMHQEITFILPSRYTRINHFHYHQYFHPGQNHHVLSPALLIFLCLFLTSNRTCGVKSLKGSWDHITPLLKTLHSTFPDCTLSLTLPPIHLD